MWLYHTQLLLQASVNSKIPVFCFKSFIASQPIYFGWMNERQWRMSFCLENYKCLLRIMKHSKYKQVKQILQWNPLQASLGFDNYQFIARVVVSLALFSWVVLARQVQVFYYFICEYFNTYLFLKGKNFSYPQSQLCIKISVSWLSSPWKVSWMICRHVAYLNFNPNKIH